MKKSILYIITLLAGVMFLAGCEQTIESGVSHELAEARAKSISNLKYALEFDIPAEKDSAIAGHETIDFDYSGRGDVVLDFQPIGEPSFSVTANGRMIHAVAGQGHIIVPAKFCVRGHNSLEVMFTAGTQSLNRRDHFLYTLLVPDRARTLFPCFDQPDLKARYTLSLIVPESWKTVSNTCEAAEATTGSGSKKVVFAQTEPLSTYLFSFVAGEFSTMTMERNGRSVTMYHRETDEARIAQAPDIFKLVFDALDYMEEYTGVPYPFAKYDFVVLPDFQYGGMEHTGATLYNDRRIFLSENPTTAELLDRAALISHETSHMWFGDYVTMKWFDDVWTKEVFANWFAAQMARPSFPEVNHVLNDMKSYFAPSYSEDRTIGSNAIQRPLDNLSNAGLIYCNIIYDKAPVVMDKLVRRMGSDAFREGIREYVRKFGYGNATWDDLIAILNSHADFDVEKWSNTWIKEKGMPVYTFSIKGNRLTVSQEDPFGQGNVWQQDIAVSVVGSDGQTQELKFAFKGGKTATAETSSNIEYCLPNSDGLGYGYFVIDSRNAEYIYNNFKSFGETLRESLLLSLYENVWRRKLSADDFVDWSSNAIHDETNPLIFGSMLSYAASAYRMISSEHSRFEQALVEYSSDETMPEENRRLAFRQLFSLSSYAYIDDMLFETWEQQQDFCGIRLSESDYTSIAYQLMVRFPDRAESIRDTQAERITNPDRKETFLFVSQACAPAKADRDAFFESLKDAGNRRPESRVLTALSLLNHPRYQRESISYIRPGLEMMEDIQKTGDIFFPSSWAKTLLGSYTSAEASDEVKAFIEEHPDYNQLLMTKIRQAGGYLLQ